ncbi:putative flavoprotein involved in K+ transport [Micromonospora phaseoli]|uniref:Putative flavoprotein involved in K+ transport n=1 Tax=Micromonospora phaseoli TaxID=1144548 RepID=A0A1H6UYU2_9ACTN|nr:NAD(P)/FAD-dependent oxidoreductase [Micromonospora phaseoli]PZV93789.1 putative flavoprotein involved in K+ transport [Micromonospora phaseoli]GIJ79935.1 FAD-dependent oxidoreductase [Micromonospora phaseoli]SEI97488.1 putative flavoprotein involved in K+ transport [Micromonospora phaseoli]
MATETPQATAAEVTAETTFAAWLDRLTPALQAADVPTITTLLARECWWRDLLALTGDLGTYHGRDRVATMLGEHLGPGSVVNVRMTTEFGPRYQGGANELIEGFITFETPLGFGRGAVRLRQEDGDWVAWTVLTELDDLRGHERAIGHHRSKGPRHNPAVRGRNWRDERQEKVRYVDGDPDVVVIGAGQGGLSVAANLGLMGVDTLVLEKSERIGDGWRKRYHSLVLHDPVWADHLPYLPYPESWPVYCPKDKIADWFESYASAMELNVWTSAEMTSSSFDETSGRWTLRVRTPDGERELHPRDVILATGAAGEPNVPAVPGRELFAGTSYHSSQHASATDWAGKKAVVVGACNSGHDIAQDLYEAGADVTIVQRSSTHIISQEHGIPAIFGSNFVEGGPPTAYADLLASGTPWPLVLDMAREGVKETARKDAELLAALDAVGFKRNDGPDGTGLMGYALAYGGGYYIDVGCSRLIADGKVKLAQGSGLAEFTPDGIRLADGRTLDADLVVLATGYRNMRETARRLFGDGVADRLPLVLGIGEDGEIGGLYRRTGHPGFWYMGGPLAWVRIYSKHLALQITAKHAGIQLPRPGVTAR